MSHFLRNGTAYRISNEVNMDIHSRLPAGNYTIKQDQFGNMFLDQIESFNITGKLYGDISSRCNRILSTFRSRQSSTGVLLTGEKGSGKSMLAKLLCQTAAESNIPTLVVSSPWHGEKFNSFLQSIDHECVVLFDEFEKTYDKDAQESLLTLLDGVFPSKKLFILTCNDKYRIDTHMRNRPGRIFYSVEYKGLDEAFIREYCGDNLDEKKYIDQVCNITSMFSSFNFDMLKALVEEMNRYKESPDKSLELLNVKAEYSGDLSYHVSIETESGVPFPEALLSGDTVVEANPLNIEDFCLDFRLAMPVSATDGVPDKGPNNNEFPEAAQELLMALGLESHLRKSYARVSVEGLFLRFRISTEGLQSVDSRKGSFVFKSAEGYIIKLSKKQEVLRNLNGLVF